MVEEDVRWSWCNGEDSGIDSDADRERAELAVYSNKNGDEVFERKVKNMMRKSEIEDGSDEDMSDSDRDSPPLLEVELTASDEDDDTSVLELVIPMQKNRCPRGSKEKFQCSSFLKRLFCCVSYD